jgi:LysR family transcriptional regulator, low CO2-responsive transcriptional regulator
MLHFVSLGVGLAVVNGCVVPGADLVARPIDDLPTVTYSAVFRRGSRRDPRVSAMLDVIRTSAP